MAHIGEQAVDYIILGVALVSLALTALAWGAYRRTRDRRLLFVAAAFALFVAKSLGTVYAIATQAIAHEDLEMLGSLVDLAAVLLLVSPLLLRRA